MKVAAIFSAALLVSACSSSRVSVAVPAPALPGHNEPRELAVEQQVKQALERLTYGPRPGEAALVRREGLDRWLKRQLTPENWPDRGADSALVNVPVITMAVRMLVDSSPQQDVYIRRRKRALGLADTAHYAFDADDSVRFKRMSEQGNLRVNQYLGAKMIRAVASDHQLQEVMTDFWENHFSVYRGKMPTQFTLLEYDRDVIRPNALGRFRDLLGAVAHSAAMLYYLDNYTSNCDSAHLTLPAWQNFAKARNATDSARIRNNAMRRRGGLNENYGRELMELHTLGVDGGYTQGDVINVARALTGWTLETPREGGGFRFNAAAHDAEQKIVLGHTLAAGRGVEDGEEVLDLLARHPSTAQYIATKLVRHFVSDSAPVALVKRAAAMYIKSDGDIRRVLAVIVSSPEFYAKAAVRAKVKTPYELVASTYRAMQGTPDSVARSINLTQQLGQQLYGHLTPEGWPDNAGSWMNTGSMLQRINFGSNVGAGRIPGIAPARWEPAAKLKGAPLADQVDAVGSALLQGEMSPDTHNVLMSGSNPLSARAGVAMNAAGRGAPTLGELIGLAIASPEFQRR
ncbi:MAG: DUF1800 domain-containing protein [Gemmatimonadota bacterium]|nr:DUF1800 domain-containing protein [Gemmatimonadota bacterium]